MIKRLWIAIAMTFAMASTAAAATVAVATGNVNLRAGPSTQYPAITVVPVGASIVTHGCLAGYTWCDVGFGNYRGWVSAHYIQIYYQGNPIVLTPAVATTVGIAVVGFSNVYWDTYYSSYPWYYHGPAYYAQATRSCGPNGCSGTVTGARGGVATGTGGCGPRGCAGAGTVTGPNGGSAQGARACGPRGCAGGGTVTGPNGGSVQGASACGPRGCVGGYSAVGPNGGTRSGVGGFHR